MNKILKKKKVREQWYRDEKDRLQVRYSDCYSLASCKEGAREGWVWEDVNL